MKSLNIWSPSRIHGGLLNESGICGFVDRGFGFSLTEPHWELCISIGPEKYSGIKLSPEHKDSIKQTLKVLWDHFGELQLSIEIRNQVLAHIGLGSKTSLLLALGRAFCELKGLQISHLDIARLVGRGGTSGIGVYSTLMGGYISDAGHKYPEEKSCFGPSSMKLSNPPRLLSYSPINWAKVIHFRFTDIGIHGEIERRIFRESCPIPKNETEACLIIFNNYIESAIRERDKNKLQKGISDVQKIGFKKVEWENQDEVTKEFRRYWNSKNPQCPLGLSSMGPTIYCITANPENVFELLRCFDTPPLHCNVSNISNSGIIIK